ncbi:hypothetical protein NPIL_637031 [Nephila pilipes]|uniref:Uncharacterized protein n=1 Tax=Nephila pilipes TaxID=299642 RepID=A0A8X6IVY2_NEPPI|nr:hypothetical protein NPIL_637031 [Nephila pilipes]
MFPDEQQQSSMTLVAEDERTWTFIEQYVTERSTPVKADEYSDVCELKVLGNNRRPKAIRGRYRKRVSRSTFCSGTFDVSHYPEVVVQQKHKSLSFLSDRRERIICLQEISQG